MRALQIHKPGVLDSHRIEELPGLAPGAGEVLVDIKAIPVNYPDLLVITGQYQSIPQLPFAPGMEAAGVVRDVGTGVSGVRRGDRVLIHVSHGAYATEAVVRKELCMALPQTTSFTDAGVFGLAAQTAWFALIERAGYRPGDTVLVNGATGAVGKAAVEIAAALGATVLAGVNSLTRAEALLKDVPCKPVNLAADNLRDDLRKQVQAATNGKGADIVIDMLGGDIFDASLRALAWNGRIVSVGFAAGRIAEVKTNYLLVKNIAATGLQWTDYRDREPWKVARAHNTLVGLWERGALHSTVMQTFPLQDFAKALRLIESRSAMGRVVLTTD